MGTAPPRPMSTGCARRHGAAAAGVVLACWASTAEAADPLNSSNHGETSAKREAEHDKVDLVPVVGGSSDLGVGAGAIGAITRLAPSREPFVWKVELGMFVSAKTAEREVIVPYESAFVRVTIPRLFGSGAELMVRPGYDRETTLGYYGLGNAAKDTSPAGASARYFNYERLHTGFAATLRWPFVDHVAGRLNAGYMYNRLAIPPGSKVDEDSHAGQPEVRNAINPTSPHGVTLFGIGAQWDNRDSEVSSHRGSFHQIDLHVSPGGNPELPYRYAQLGASARTFVPLVARRLTLALRVAGDVLFGNPPFYELPRFDDTYAIGGPTGVRGIPAQRYNGKAKALGNVEVRSELFPFHALGKDLLFGAVAFVDAGRVWADLHANPALDGTGIGLKVGGGGGLRVISGDTFAVRADIAWSPDARPLGGYFGAGQAFLRIPFIGLPAGAHAAICLSGRWGENA